MGREAQTHGGAFLVGLYEDPQPGEAKGPPRGTATAGSLPLDGAPLEPHLLCAHLCGFPPCESRRGRAPQGFFGVLGVFPPLCLPPAPSTGAPCALQFPPADTWWGSETGHPAAGGGAAASPRPLGAKRGLRKSRGGAMGRRGSPPSAPGAAAQSLAGRAARGGKRGI